MRRRTLILLLLPIILILWAIGWVLLYVGEKPTTEPENDNIHITVLLPQTEEIPA
jgi:flagellar basal body-associated protein FliL